MREASKVRILMGCRETELRFGGAWCVVRGAVHDRMIADTNVLALFEAAGPAD